MSRVPVDALVAPFQPEHTAALATVFFPSVETVTARMTVHPEMAAHTHRKHVPRDKQPGSDKSISDAGQLLV